MYLLAHPGVLQAFDHHPVARGQPVGDDPTVVLGATKFHRAFADAQVLIDQQHAGHAGAVAQDGPLRHADALLVDGLFQAHTDEAAR
ncbi:hypothetical protein D3C80_1887430 [compost metagenome]